MDEKRALTLEKRAIGTVFVTIIDHELGIGVKICTLIKKNQALASKKMQDKLSY